MTENSTVTSSAPRKDNNGALKKVLAILIVLIAIGIITALSLKWVENPIQWLLTIAIVVVAIAIVAGVIIISKNLKKESVMRTQMSDDTAIKLGRELIITRYGDRVLLQSTTIQTVGMQGYEEVVFVAYFNSIVDEKNIYVFIINLHKPEINRALLLNPLSEDVKKTVSMIASKPLIESVRTTEVIRPDGSLLRQSDNGNNNSQKLEEVR